MFLFITDKKICRTAQPRWSSHMITAKQVKGEAAITGKLQLEAVI